MANGNPAVPQPEIQKPDAMEKIERSRPLGINRSIGMGPRTFEEAWRFAKLIAGSDLAPKDYVNKPANVLVAIQMGAEVGLSPMAAIQNIAVINGRPSLWGDAALAVVQVHPAYEWHKETFEGAGDARKAIFQIKRKGHEVHTVQFSVLDAKTAKLWMKRGHSGGDTPWVTNPDRMLQMRARGFGLRDKFADALRGLGIAEEAMDLPPVNTIEAQPDVMATVAAQLPAGLKRASEIVKEQSAPVVDASTITAAQEKLDEQRKQPPVDPPPVEELNQPTGKDLFGSIVEG